MLLAPIVLIVYNRPWHTQQTVEALHNCDLAEVSDLYIFADGPKEDASDEIRQKIAKVRKYIHSIDGFKSVHIQESPTNKGLANSVIQGVSEVILGRPCNTKEISGKTSTQRKPLHILKNYYWKESTQRQVFGGNMIHITPMSCLE